MPRVRYVARRNLELVFPEKSDSERAEILRQSWKVLARHLVDFSRIMTLTPEEARRRFNTEEFERVYAELQKRNEGVGILSPTAHFGSFELTVQAFAVNGFSVAILARDFALPRFTKWWNKRREKFGCNMIGRKGGYQEMIQSLKQGRGVTVLFDQNVKENHAVFVDFFGLQAATTKSLALAAIRTGAPILFIAGANDVGGNYQIFYKEVLYEQNSPLTLARQVEHITRQLNACVEEVVRQRPEQWFWIHRRFKTRPAGEEETLYRESP